MKSILLPSPPDMFEVLSSFRLQRLFCDVRLKFARPDRQDFFAHRIVLAANSPFFSEACVDGAGGGGGAEAANAACKEILLPAAIEDDTMAFIIYWMYNEAPKIELSSNDDKLDAKSNKFLLNLRLAVELLNVVDLQLFLDNHFVSPKVEVVEEPEGTSSSLSLLPLSTGENDVSTSEYAYDDPADDDNYDDDDRNLENNCGVSVGGVGGGGVDGGWVQTPESLPNSNRFLKLKLKRLRVDLPSASSCGENGSENNREKVIKIDPDGAKGVEFDQAEDAGVDLDRSEPGTVERKAGDQELAPSRKKTSVKAKGDKVVRRKRKNLSQKKRLTRRKGTDKSIPNKTDPLDAERRRLAKVGPPVPCEKCGMTIRKYNMSAHNRIYHGDNEKAMMERLFSAEKHDPVLSPLVADKTFRCSLCPYVKSRHEMKGRKKEKSAFLFDAAKHLYREHSVVCPNVCFPCPIESCSTVVYGRVTANKHRINVHENADVKIACSVCGLEMKEGSLKMHHSLVHAGDEAKVPCQVCGKTFANIWYLKHHARSHEDEKDFVCRLCGEDGGGGGFRSNDRSMYRHHSYRRHGRLIPPDAPIHRCSDCDYATPVQHFLKAHRSNTHAAVAFACAEPECAKAFKSQRALDLHFRRVHRSEETSKCPECLQVFHSATGLRYHLWRVHHIGRNGAIDDDDDCRLERPFKCAYCNHTSGLSGNVRKHVKNVHSDLPVKYVDLRTLLVAEKELENSTSNLLTTTEKDHVP